ncbi:hypothetical protein Glove_251g28 [Diversispora epigaea]|uniref:Male-enhanced antigen 1 n=1 Tax=Diversispora epigaea TaxID=1348612 RepID=A0A397I8D2_9GLOM|nr:hypothetical protein Glove_251g28 [Diversispora epigaea]
MTNTLDQNEKNVIIENINAPHERINNNYNLSNSSNELENINLNNDNDDNNDDVFKDDDSDLSELEPFGYKLLNQEDDENEGEDENEDEDNDLQKSEILNLKNEIPNKLQISPSNEERIPDDDLNIINSIMKNVQIPDSSIPEWAKVIPEESWLPVIINNNNNNNNNSTLLFNVNN